MYNNHNVYDVHRMYLILCIMDPVAEVVKTENNNNILDSLNHKKNWVKSRLPQHKRCGGEMPPG